MTLTALLEESLRTRLARTTAEPHTRVRLTTTGRGGLRPGIDLDDSASGETPSTSIAHTR